MSPDSGVYLGATDFAPLAQGVGHEDAYAITVVCAPDGDPYCGQLVADQTGSAVHLYIMRADVGYDHYHCLPEVAR